MNAIELTQRAVEDHALFKRAGQQLEAMLPDREAAQLLVTAFRAGIAPGWLAAYLLGCNGHEVGYYPVREILFARLGQLSESYAGVAIAKIGGAKAYGDLRNILLTAHSGKARRGAAYGIVHLKIPTAVDDFLDAYRRKLLPRGDTARHIANSRPANAWLLSLLESTEDSDQRLGLKAVFNLLASSSDIEPHDVQVARGVLWLIESGGVKSHEIAKDKLLAWSKAICGGSAG